MKRHYFPDELERIAETTWPAWSIENPEAAIEAVRLVLAGERPAFHLTPWELARVRELAEIEENS